MGNELTERHNSSAERESRGHNDKAQGFVEYDRFQRPKPKQPDQKRQAELCATKPNQSAKRADACPRAEGCQGMVLVWNMLRALCLLIETLPQILDRLENAEGCGASFQRYDKSAITLSTGDTLVKEPVSRQIIMAVLGRWGAWSTRRALPAGDRPPPRRPP